VVRVVGIGGVFFRAKDPEALRAWYAEHLGIDVQDRGGVGFDSEFGRFGWATDPREPPRALAAAPA
jgi:hypothetical protein